ncbi:MAG: DMT family transporter [Bacteroidetes bacterium]|nr:DMT family transporter [Bacteroidota bacterium]
MINLKNISAIGWMLFSALCFALMGAFSHQLAWQFDWKVISFTRASINFIFVAALALWTKKELLFFKAPKFLWGRSINGTLSIFGTFYTLSKLPIAEATSVINTMPLWMAILISFVSKKRVPNGVWFSVLCGIAGVMFIQQPHFDEGNFAVAVGITGAFFASVAVYNLHLIKNLHPTTIVAHFTFVASIISFIVMIPSAHTLFDAARYNPLTIIALIGVGASGTVAQLAMTRAYMLGNPAINSTVGLAQVAFAAVLDILIWSREFNEMTIIGIVLITIPTTLFAARIQFRNRTQSV